MKCCFKCGDTKEFSEFYKHSQMSDGHLGKCKECTKKDAIAVRNKKLDHYQEYDRQRGNLPHRVNARAGYLKTERDKERSNLAKKNWIKRNPLKRRAQLRLATALKNGSIKKEPCIVCKKTKVQAHHDDYNRPLDVTWFCTKHHAEHHKKERECTRKISASQTITT